MSTEKQPWKVTVHSHQIADTGDYDGYYEISNGKTSLYTNDEDLGDESEEHGFEELVEALNKTQATFWTNGDDEANGYRMEAEHFKRECHAMTTALAAKDAEIEQWKLRAEMLLRTREPEQATIDWATDKVIELKNAEIKRLKGLIRLAHDTGYVSGNLTNNPRVEKAWQEFKTSNNLQQ